ncbi:XisI protein [Sphaerothrix gracilis]|uniref:XisI protein n=1 Tax=Sphaerothrix gracilis TaxID=3151835 RepID=UPI0031FC8647
MDKIIWYREIIQKILNEYCGWAANAPAKDIQEHVCFDENRDHYFWFNIGWSGKQRVFNIVVYLRIQDNKIWVEEDWTQEGIVNDLLAHNISKEDVVLGFHHPSKRPLTEFDLLQIQEKSNQTKIAELSM